MTDTQKPHPDLKDFTPEEWDEMIDMLTGFAYKYFEARFEGNIHEAITPDGATYKDIAQEIVKRVLQGSRHWDPEQHGDLLPYMAGQVQSLFDHGFNSWEARNVDSMEVRVDKDGNSTFLVEEAIVADKPRTRANDQFSTANPEMVIIDKEIQVERKKLLETVLNAVSEADDDELWDLAEAYLDESGEYAPRQIASRLEIPLTEFHNRRKRLVRLVKKHVSEKSSEIGG